MSKYPVLYQKSNCDNFDDAEEVLLLLAVFFGRSCGCVWLVHVSHYYVTWHRRRLVAGAQACAV